jgi:hypothetical protein
MASEIGAVEMRRVVVESAGSELGYCSEEREMSRGGLGAEVRSYDLTLKCAECAEANE